MKNNIVLILMLSFIITSCGGGFKAKRVSGKESDEKAMEITDKWVNGDTEIVVRGLLRDMQGHKGFKRYMRRLGREPKVFIGEIKNLTSDAYFPINDLNDEFLTEISASGDFILVDAAQRDAILKELTYQHDGMVNPATAKRIGMQEGVDLMIFGNVYMRPRARDGKTIKQYNVNLRMTDVEKGIEVLRVRQKVDKFSEQSASGW